MAFILRLEKRRLPKNIKEIFLQAEKGESEIIIPAIVFAELAYLSEKGRIDTSLKKAIKYLEKYPNITAFPLSVSTINHAFEINDIPELHDRLIAAVGKTFKASILTNDPAIHNSKFVNTICDQ